MTTRVTVKRRITVNGREYASVEEMPEDIRRAYEQAMASAGRDSHAVNTGGSTTNIVFNGRAYGRVEDMPGSIRRLYEAAMTAVDADSGAGLGAPAHDGDVARHLGQTREGDAASVSMAPIEVGGGSGTRWSRLAFVAIVIVLLLGAVYYLSHLLR